MQLGWKLGRHPRLAIELEGIFSDDDALAIVNRRAEFYKENSKHGERFAEVFKLSDFKTRV